MDDEEIGKEAQSHFKKCKLQLAEDILREANEETEPLDRIKHTLKVMALQQLVLSERTGRTNCILIILAVINALGAVATIVSLYLAFLAK
jgi:hypothetical protein